MVAYDGGAHSGEKECLGGDELLHTRKYLYKGLIFRVKRYLHGHPSDLLVN